MIFREVVFYHSESITFEGQVAIWRVSGLAKMSKKASGEHQKYASSKKRKTYKTNRKNTKRGPQ